ncbi:MAG TPA: hypothetical protein VFW63_10995 [Acidimicrobiales bacterium]|nr:hypothetical protein [Acidimicrobiales bacterium]
MRAPTDISVDGISSALGNVLYTAVGLGILGINHLQDQRRQISRQVGEAVRQVTEQVERTVGGR